MLKSKNFVILGVIACLMMLSLFMVSSLYAAGTPAGTQIKNQASATYTDVNNNIQVSTSNEVITIVTQVCGITITPNGAAANAPGQDQTAAAGTTVYFPYLLTNPGNGNDTYTLGTAVDNTGGLSPTNVEVCLDANGNGQVDVGETCAATPTTGTVAADETIHLIVRYTVPVGAAAGQFASVNLTGASVFNGACTDNDNWNRTTVANEAVITTYKSATPSNVLPGATITYTVSGSNTGSVALLPRQFTTLDLDGDGAVDPALNQLGFLVEDSYPWTNNQHIHVTGTPGTDFVSGNPAGTYLYKYSNGNWSTDGNVAAWGGTTNIRGVGYFIGVVGGTVLATGQSYDFTWNAIVNNNYTGQGYTADTAPPTTDANTYINNRATSLWQRSAGVTADTNSNTTQTKVDAAYSVEIGQKGHPDGGMGGPNYTSGPYTVEITTVADTSIVPSGVTPTMMAGTCVSFTNTLRNTGTVTDIFNIGYAWTANQITGATVMLFKSDGLTPLGDANADGLPDSGPVAAGATADIIVKVCVPATAVTDALPHDITLTATSTEDKSAAPASDTTVDRIQGIQAAAMALQNNNGGVLNNTVYSQVASPGTCLIYPLAVTNSAPVGGAWETYNLSQTVALPAGWTLEFYPDTNDDQQPDTGAAAISATTSLAPQATYRYVAKVCIPEGQTPLGDGSPATVGDGQQLTFRAAGAATGLVLTQDDYAEVSTDNSFTFEPDNAGTASPCGTVFYRHLLKNTGTVQQSFTVGLDAGYTPRTGWLYTFSLDGVTYSASVTITNLAVGATQEIYVKVFVPCSEAINVTEIGQITATNTTAGTTKTRLDATTVVQATLRLTKSVECPPPTVCASALPGADLTYTVAYQNLSTENMLNAFIYDAIPAHTGFRVGTATGGTAIVYSSNNGATWVYTPAGGGCGALAGYDYCVTNIRWTLTTPLVGGAGGNVAFVVRVK